MSFGSTGDAVKLGRTIDRRRRDGPFNDRMAMRYAV